MSIHTSVGTTPTILVIVVTIGDGWLRVGEPCAAFRARPTLLARARVVAAAATGAKALGEDAAGV
jgi:hypothetical protein